MSCHLRRVLKGAGPRRRRVEEMCRVCVQGMPREGGGFFLFRVSCVDLIIPPKEEEEEGGGGNISLSLSSLFIF